MKKSVLVAIFTDKVMAVYVPEEFVTEIKKTNFDEYCLKCKQACGVEIKIMEDDSAIAPESFVSEEVFMNKLDEIVSLEAEVPYKVKPCKLSVIKSASKPKYIVPHNLGKVGTSHKLLRIFHRRHN